MDYEFLKNLGSAAFGSAVMGFWIRVLLADRKELVSSLTTEQERNRAFGEKYVELATAFKFHLEQSGKSSQEACDHIEEVVKSEHAITRTAIKEHGAG